MKKWTETIRVPDTNITLSVKITHSVLILLLGIALGIFSKWLDILTIDDAVWLQHIWERLDLRNVFSALAIWLLIALVISVYSGTPLRAGLNVFLFFAGMCVSYHIYTVAFAGFNPRSYMRIWYGITLLSPVLAYVCWFGKGETKVSLIIDILILAVMMRVCFAIGFWYFDFTSMINTLIFVGAAVVLYHTPKRTFVSLLGAIVLSYVTRLYL